LPLALLISPRWGFLLGALPLALDSKAKAKTLDSITTMLKNIKISNKLALMVAIPIMGLIYFTIDSTLEKREIVNQMNLLQALSALTVKSSSLIHELQKERGLSAGFLGSQGAEFSKELLAQRLKTDKAIKELDSFVKKFNFKDVDTFRAPFDFDIVKKANGIFRRIF
jgi:hypothetical protein